MQSKERGHRLISDVRNLPVAEAVCRHCYLPNATCLYLSFFVCSFVRKYFCNEYLLRRLMQGDEIWQDGRPGWVAGHLFWWTLAQGLTNCQGQKVKNVSNALHSREPGVTMAGDGDRHVGIYASPDNWCTCLQILTAKVTKIRNWVNWQDLAQECHLPSLRHVKSYSKIFEAWGIKQTVLKSTHFLAPCFFSIEMIMHSVTFHSLICYPTKSIIEWLVLLARFFFKVYTAFHVHLSFTLSIISILKNVMINVFHCGSCHEKNGSWTVDYFWSKKIQLNYE